MIAYGGLSASGPPSLDSLRGDAVAYDPAADTWRMLPDAPLDPRFGAIAVWTGTEVLVTGGSDAEFTALVDGAAYDPAVDRWRTIADLPDEVADAISGVWTGCELVVFGNPAGGPVDEPTVQHAAAYDPGRDRWRQLPDLPTPQPYAVVISGRDAVYLLGESVGDDGQQAAFLAYDVGADRWTRLPDPPSGFRNDPTAVWSGAELFVWGGSTRDGSAAPNLTWRPPAAP